MDQTSCIHKAQLGKTKFLCKILGRDQSGDFATSPVVVRVAGMVPTMILMGILSPAAFAQSAITALPPGAAHTMVVPVVAATHTAGTSAPTKDVAYPKKKTAKKQAPEQSPKDIVEGFYAPYAAGQTPPDVLPTLRGHSTQGFGSLLQGEADCIARTNALCKLDFDVIINGQNFDGVKMSDTAVQKSKSGLNVCASFENAGAAQKVCYRFVKENSGAHASSWLIDDVLDYSDGKEFSVRKLLAGAQ